MSKQLKSRLLSLAEIDALLRDYACDSFPYNPKTKDGIRNVTLWVFFKGKHSVHMSFHDMFKAAPNVDEVPTEAELIRAVRLYVKFHFPGFEKCYLAFHDLRTGPGLNVPVAPAAFVNKGAWRDAY